MNPSKIKRGVVVDTNILIAYLLGDTTVIETLSVWKLSGRALLVSPIIRAEILSHSDLSNDDIEAAKDLLSNFVSINFNDQLAEYAGELRRKYRINLPDAAIAATAIFTRTALVTRNERDFKKIVELQIITI